MSFSLESFEYLVYNRRYEEAGRELLGLLRFIDSQYGLLSGHFEGSAQAADVADSIDDHLLARLISAITTLATDREFQFSDTGFGITLNLHRWLSAIFAASPFRNGDHILRALGRGGPETDLSVANANLRKFELFYFADSEIPVDVDGMWEHDKKLMAGLALTLMSPRFLGTPAAHGKREALLKWLPAKLDQVDLDDLPGGILHDVYMHCSYADLPSKHDIKKPLNALIRRKLAFNGLSDMRHGAQPPETEGDKPVLLVLLEWFSKEHSIYRTHSLTMEGMRKRFHVIGMGYPERVDDSGRAVFDEFVTIVGDNVWHNVAQVRSVCLDRDVQVLYMPSVGMFPLTMIQANLRVAPLQLMALGHPATSHSPTMDYVVVEEDYVGDPACFSEELLVLPKDGMPYRAPAGMKDLTLVRQRDADPDVVRIAVASTTMKLNPGFLLTCQRIASQAKAQVHFHFLIGQAVGLVLPQVKRLIRRYLGDKATVHAHQPYRDYMNVLAQCDMFVNPFPFGNTNGIVDTVFAGMVGVCRTGREVHEHIDEGMFGRLGFPSWMVARTNEEYVASALRLVDDADERRALAQELSGPRAIDKVIFKGRHLILGERIHALWKARLANQATLPELAVVA